MCAKNSFHSFMCKYLLDSEQEKQDIVYIKMAQKLEVYINIHNIK